MKLGILLICHDQLEDCQRQIRFFEPKVKEIIIMASNTDTSKLKYDKNKTTVYERPNNNDWGNAKRKEGIKFIKSKFLLMVNSDDVYKEELFESLRDDVFIGDIIYFNALNKDGTILNAELKRGKVGCGNVIIKTSLFKDIEYDLVEYHADWLFIEKCLKEASFFYKIDKVLMENK